MIKMISSKENNKGVKKQKRIYCARKCVAVIVSLLLTVAVLPFSVFAKADVGAEKILQEKGSRMSPSMEAMGSIMIGVSSFYFGMDQGPLTETMAKALSRVFAKDEFSNDIPLSDIYVSQREMDTINSAILAKNKEDSPYALTFNARDRISITTEVYLKDHMSAPIPGQVILFGDDFRYPVERGALNDASVKALSKVAIQDLSFMSKSISDIEVDALSLAEINHAILSRSTGIYEMTLSEQDGASMRIFVTLYQDVVIPPPSETESIEGNHFIYGLYEDVLSEDMAKRLANISARYADNSVMDLQQVTVHEEAMMLLNHAILTENTKKTSFDITFYTPDMAETVIRVNLKNEIAGIRGLGVSTYRIGGNHFSYGVEQGVVSTEQAKLLANVEIENLNGVGDALHHVVVNAAQLEAINRAIVSELAMGEYPLSFTAPDNTTITVVVTLQSNGGGVLDSVTPSMVSSNRIIYGKSNGALSEETSRFYAQAVAFDFVEEVFSRQMTVVDLSYLQALNQLIESSGENNGVLKFSTPGGAMYVTSEVFLRDHAAKPDADPHNPNRTTSGNIGANDFTVRINEPGVVGMEEAKQYGRAIAMDMFGNMYAISGISVNDIELQTINNAKEAGHAGVFPLTFTSPKGKTVTVKVTVE